MLLDLNDKEVEMLAEILRSFLSELRTEVVHTDSHDYRERLKEQENLVRQIIGKVEKPAGL